MMIIPLVRRQLPRAALRPILSPTTRRFTPSAQLAKTDDGEEDVDSSDLPDAEIVPDPLPLVRGSPLALEALDGVTRAFINATVNKHLEEYDMEFAKFCQDLKLCMKMKEKNSSKIAEILTRIATLEKQKTAKTTTITPPTTLSASVGAGVKTATAAPHKSPLAQRILEVREELSDILAVLDPDCKPPHPSILLQLLLGKGNGSESHYKPKARSGEEAEEAKLEEAEAEEEARLEEEAEEEARLEREAEEEARLEEEEAEEEAILEEAMKEKLRQKEAAKAEAKAREISNKEAKALSKAAKKAAKKEREEAKRKADAINAAKQKEAAQQRAKKKAERKEAAKKEAQQIKAAKEQEKLKAPPVVLEATESSELQGEVKDEAGSPGLEKIATPPEVTAPETSGEKKEKSEQKELSERLELQEMEKLTRDAEKKNKANGAEKSTKNDASKDLESTRVPEAITNAVDKATEPPSEIFAPQYAAEQTSQPTTQETTAPVAVQEASEHKSEETTARPASVDNHEPTSSSNHVPTAADNNEPNKSESDTSQVGKVKSMLKRWTGGLF
ncbi:hypothetical protein QBC43DRAFT_317387 [Cladorrhinum sp. PSN259]|nr:hypothetical protein QBC43DRAFT_317387 [Cladorrhinum sp. PSN259]